MINKLISQIPQIKQYEGDVVFNHRFGFLHSCTYGGLL